MEVEDEETPVGEVAVELKQDLVGGAVCGFEGRVSAEDPELRRVLVRTIPKKRESRVKDRSQVRLLGTVRASYRWALIMDKAGAPPWVQVPGLVCTPGNAR